jgi:hypothetical protein
LGNFPLIIGKMAGGNSKAIALPLAALIKEYSVFKTDYSSTPNNPPFPLILAFISLWMSR